MSRFAELSCSNLESNTEREERRRAWKEGRILPAFVDEYKQFYHKRYHRAETEFLDEIQTKVFKIFLLAILSLLYSFALKFISSNSRNLWR